MMMRANTLSGLLAFALFLAGAFSGSTSGQTPKAPEEKSGIPVGAQAPKFQLHDQNNQERSLDEFVKQGKVALVFYRSASW